MKVYDGKIEVEEIAPEGCEWAMIEGDRVTLFLQYFPAQTGGDNVVIDA
jgi:hypothetical protein